MRPRPLLNSVIVSIAEFSSRKSQWLWSRNPRAVKVISATKAFVINRCCLSDSNRQSCRRGSSDDRNEVLLLILIASKYSRSLFVAYAASRLVRHIFRSIGADSNHKDSSMPELLTILPHSRQWLPTRHLHLPLVRLVVWQDHSVGINRGHVDTVCDAVTTIVDRFVARHSDVNVLAGSARAATSP